MPAPVGAVVGLYSEGRPMTRLEAVREILASYRYRYEDERDLQAGIAVALLAARVDYHQEERLAAGDIVDFLVGDVAVEVKVDGSPSAVLRQLMRYAQSPRVASLLLVTRRSVHAHHMPPELNGKPLLVLALEALA